MATKGESQRDSDVKQVPDHTILRLAQSSGEESHLIGSKCISCGEAMLGSHNMCLKCGSTEVKSISLGNKGKLFSFTTIMHPPPECEVSVPYGSGWVELPEGVLVPTLLTETDVGALSIGMHMEMVAEEFKQNEEGDKVVTYKFRPACSSNSRMAI